MNETTKTEAAEIAAILQSYINVCGITQYVEPIARNFDVIEKIKCKLRICNMPQIMAINAERRLRPLSYIRRGLPRFAIARSSASFGILR